eukprot:3837266-Amphidinium_carterae.1
MPHLSQFKMYVSPWCMQDLDMFRNDALVCIDFYRRGKVKTVAISLRWALQAWPTMSHRAWQQRWNHWN